MTEVLHSQGRKHRRICLRRYLLNSRHETTCLLTQRIGSFSAWQVCLDFTKSRTQGALSRGSSKLMKVCSIVRKHRGEGTCMINKGMGTCTVCIRWCHHRHNSPQAALLALICLFFPIVSAHDPPMSAWRNRHVAEKFCSKQRRSS